LEFKYDPGEVVARVVNESESLEDCARFLRDYAAYLPRKLQGCTPLIKDPFAVLSAEWLAERWDIEVIVMVRHPAGFAGSLKMKGWRFPFSDFLKQPLLINGPLKPFEEDIVALENETHDVIDEATLLWKMIYSVVHGCGQRNENYRIVKHEEVALSPIESFRSLYETLSLDFTDDVQSTIRHHSDMNGAEDEKSYVYSNNIQRDSKAIVQNWKDRLTREEVDRVRTLTEPEASHFYDEDEW
jgi:hypothetical protein